MQNKTSENPKHMWNSQNVMLRRHKRHNDIFICFFSLTTTTTWVKDIVVAKEHNGTQKENVCRIYVNQVSINLWMRTNVVA